jgi:hypothetical protein
MIFDPTIKHCEAVVNGLDLAKSTAKNNFLSVASAEAVSYFEFE